MSEIREAYDGSSPDPQRLPDELFDLFHFLHDLVQDYVIKGLVGVFRKTALEVPVVNAQPLFHAFRNCRVVRLDSLDLGPLFFGQEIEKVPCIPPIDPPATDRSFSIPNESTRCH